MALSSRSTRTSSRSSKTTRAISQRRPSITSRSSPTPTPPPDRRAELTRYAEDHDLELIFFDPPEHFDHAILGLVFGFNQEPAVLYDEQLVLEAIARDLGEDEAQEWFDYNTVGAYLGPATPRFLTRP
jgi:hypothetical protein